MDTVVVVVGVLVAIGLLASWYRRRHWRRATQTRLATSSIAGNTLPERVGDSGVPEQPLRRWLFLAGWRSPDAVSTYLAWTVGLGLVGLALGILLWWAGILVALRANLEAIPGRVGLLFVPVVVVLPVLLPLMLAAVPTLRVRRARRARVHLILRDLYPVLELFASLAQAGLAFDAALARVLLTLGPDRPLGRELQTFQAEVLGGADRSRSFRRLARRIQLPQVSSFTSALIRAHEVGIGLAATLRRHADELRNELREQALARAQSLPARLVFPLVICFLPGIFVMSLGPAFYGFLVDTAGFGTNR